MTSSLQFTCRTEQRADGRWNAVHVGPELGTVEVSAPTREGAIEKIRNELRYRLELCPCSGERYRDIHIEIVERNA